MEDKHDTVNNSVFSVLSSVARKSLKLTFSTKFKNCNSNLTLHLKIEVFKWGSRVLTISNDS